mgnify:CR=1 FL=1
MVLDDAGSDDSTVLSDDHVRIQFSVSRESMRFVLHNLSEAPIKIDWDSWSFLDVKGDSRRVIHNGTALANANQPQAQTVVPPGGKITDAIIPADNVYWVNGSRDRPGRWEVRPLIPFGADVPENMLRDYEKRTFGAYMPLLVGDEKREYRPRFRVKGFCQTSCGEGGTGRTLGPAPEASVEVDAKPPKSYQERLAACLESTGMPKADCETALQQQDAAAAGK